MTMIYETMNTRGKIYKAKILKQTKENNVEAHVENKLHVTLAKHFTYSKTK